MENVGMFTHPALRQSTKYHAVLLLTHSHLRIRKHVHFNRNLFFVYSIITVYKYVQYEPSKACLPTETQEERKSFGLHRYLAHEFICHLSLR